MSRAQRLAASAVDAAVPERQTAGAIVPRLLDITAAAKYLGVSSWTVRDYVAAGLIPAIDLPPLRPREGDRGRSRLRRLLLDRRDLDSFIDSLKARPGGTR